MAKGARTWILLVVLVVGAAGWLIGQAATPPPTSPPPATPTKAAPGNPHYPIPPGPYPGPKNWTLTVGPSACDVKESSNPIPVAVITRGTHSITYKSDKGQLLGIVFHAPLTYPTARAPFKNMTWGGVDEDGSYLWVLVCDKGTCSTGTALKTPPYDASGGYWKTDQILEGAGKCDAGIIIQP